jgi:hypothetical protein
VRLLDSMSRSKGEDSNLAVLTIFRQLPKSFTDFEKEVLIALSHGKTNPSSMAQEIRKPISSLSQILHRRMSHGIVEKYVEGRYRIPDPVFSDWLSQRYPLMAGD